MRAHDLRLPLTALVVWGVGIAAVLVPTLALVCAAVCSAVAIALLAAAARWRVRYAAVFAVGLGIAGIVAGQVALAQPARERAAQQTNLTAVHATVTSKVEPANGGGWRWEADAEIAGARVPIAVFMRDDRPAGLDLGASVSLSGTTAEPFIGQRAAVRVIASAAPAVLRAPGGVFAVAADLRTRFSAVSAQFPGEGAQLVPGLSVGDTTIVTPELTAKMTQASLSHLVAVSGANCAIVTGVAFWLAALCGALRRTRVVVALVVLAGFIVLVTPEPSVVRAGAMSAVAMIALLLGRERLGVPVLSLAVIVLLALDPWLATSIGFALSAAATGALLTLARPLADKLSVIMPRGLALGVAVPLAAQLVCAPIIVLIDPHVSIVGMLANMVAGPAAGIVTILGLVGCLLAVVPWVGFGLTALAWAPASWIASVANVAVQVPGGSVPWPDGVAGAVLLAVLTAAAVCIALSRERRARWVSFVVVLSTVVAGVGSVTVRSVIAPHAVPAAWAIAQCDVGQGDAIVIRSAGAVAVIDTGLEPQRLSDCLELLAVSRVDVLVLTHFDMDHMGGSSALHGRVDVVMHGPVDDAAAQRRLDDLRDAGAEIVQARLNMTGTLGTAQWRVLWPKDNVQPGNDASVVWEISGGDVPRSLFLGDMSEAGQQQLLATKQVRGPYDVVKVSHHGSADQEPRTYAEAHATIALIGVGKNDYGHPRPETISMLERAGSAVFRTDTAGTITVVREEGGWSVWRQRAPPRAPGRAVSMGRRVRRGPGRSDPGSAHPWPHH